MKSRLLLEKRALLRCVLKHSVALCAALAAGLATASETLPSGVAAALKAAQIPPASVAIVVQPVDARAPRVSHNARQPMNPASVMKLVTTYAGLGLLGPAHTWRTELLAEQAPRDGRLAGPLYLKGSGDPKFAIEHLTALLRQLRARGVQHLAGDLVLDRSAFSIAALDPGAFDDKPMRPYNIGPDALLTNFQSLRFTLQADGSRVLLLQETPSDGLRIDQRLQLAERECSSDWKDQIALRLTPENGGHTLEFAGSYARGCGEKVLNLAPLAADAHLAGLFRALWKELGGSLQGGIRPGKTPPTAQLLATSESAPLSDQIRDINKFSNNVMARQLYLALGDGSPDIARQRIGEWLAGRGLKFDELVIENGSGLSRQERISADSLNRLLLDLWQHPLMPEMIASLPIVGIDGTMKKRLKETGVSGRAHIKTGTINGVKSIAGFALDARGRRVAVTMLINHPRAPAGQPAIDALLQWVATE